MKKLMLFFITIGIISCGGGDGGSGSSNPSDSTGSKLQGSCSSSLSSFSSDSDNDSFTSSGAMTSITETEECSSSLIEGANIFGLAAGDVIYNETWKKVDKEKFLDGLASGDQDEVFPNCQVYLPQPTPGEDPACFGPRLYFQHHLDGVSRGGASLSEDLNLNCDENVCELPTGDLGLWTDTESQTGEACAAAKMNSDVRYVSQFADMGKVISALAECLVEEGTISRPSSGTTETITSAINTAVLNEGISFTSVTWSESSGAYSLVLNTSDSEFNIKTNKTSAGEYANNIWGYFGLGDNDLVVESLAFSMYGLKDSSGNQKIKFISAIFEGTTPNTGGSGDYDSNNLLEFTSSWTRDHRTIIMNDSSDNSADKLMKYSWVAGNNAPLIAADSYSRTFMAKINEDSNSGVAYYGYGNDGGTSGGDHANRLSITNFLCNWTGPGNDQSTSFKQNFAQKQVLTRSGTKSMWTPSESYIDYAPTRSCTDNPSGGSAGTRVLNQYSTGDAATHVVGTAPFNYGLTTSMGEARLLSSSELQDISSDTVYDAINAIVDPTAP